MCFERPIAEYVLPFDHYLIILLTLFCNFPDRDHDQKGWHYHGVKSRLVVHRILQLESLLTYPGWFV